MADNDLKFFQSIPWCATILNDPRYVMMPTDSRFPKETTEDEFFGATLNSERTVSACCSLYKDPISPEAQIHELITLLSLGPAVNGYQHVCHGGMIATILDEIMALIFSANRHRVEKSAKTPTTTTVASPPPVERLPIITAELLVKYLKPLATPTTVLVRVWISKVDGRKS